MGKCTGLQKPTRKKVHRVSLLRRAAPSVVFSTALTNQKLVHFWPSLARNHMNTMEPLDPSQNNAMEPPEPPPNSNPTDQDDTGDGEHTASGEGQWLLDHESFSSGFKVTAKEAEWHLIKVEKIFRPSGAQIEETRQALQTLAVKCQQCAKNVVRTLLHAQLRNAGLMYRGKPVAKFDDVVGAFRDEPSLETCKMVFAVIFSWVGKSESFLSDASNTVVQKMNIYFVPRQDKPPALNCFSPLVTHALINTRALFSLKQNGRLGFGLTLKKQHGHPLGRARECCQYEFQNQNIVGWEHLAEKDEEAKKTLIEKVMRVRAVPQEAHASWSQSSDSTAHSKRWAGASSGGFSSATSSWESQPQNLGQALAMQQRLPYPKARMAAKADGGVSMDPAIAARVQMGHREPHNPDSLNGSDFNGLPDHLRIGGAIGAPHCTAANIDVVECVDRVVGVASTEGTPSTITDGLLQENVTCDCAEELKVRASSWSACRVCPLCELL